MKRGGGYFGIDFCILSCCCLMMYCMVYRFRCMPIEEQLRSQISNTIASTKRFRHSNRYIYSLTTISPIRPHTSSCSARVSNFIYTIHHECFGLHNTTFRFLSVQNTLHTCARGPCQFTRIAPVMCLRVLARIPMLLVRLRRLS